MENLNLNSLRDRAFASAKEHGFYDFHPSLEHECLEVLCEVGESVNAYRKGLLANTNRFKAALEYMPDEKQTEYFVCIFEENIKDTYEDELADIAIRLLSFYGYMDIDLDPCERYTLENYEHCITETFDDFFFYFTSLCFCQTSNRNTFWTMPLYKIYQWANTCDIDLTWHIEQKMKYNQTRPILHNKKNYPKAVEQ